MPAAIFHRCYKLKQAIKNSPFAKDEIVARGATFFESYFTA
jgi:hypothetical protein